MRQLIVDPEFQKQIPPLTSEELDQLEKNILQEGQVLDPIIVWTISGSYRMNRWRKSITLSMSVWACISLKRLRLPEVGCMCIPKRHILYVLEGFD